MKNFDEKIRDRLFDAEMPVPDGIWDVIEQNIERKDNRPTRWFFLLTLLIGLPALFFSYYMSSDKTTLQENGFAQANSVAFNESDNIANGNFSNYDQYTENLIATQEEETNEGSISRMSHPPYPEIASYRVQNLTPRFKKQLKLSFQIAPTNINHNLIFSEDEKVQKPKTPVIADIESLQRLTTDYNSELTDLESRMLFSSNKTECPEFKPGWPGWFGYIQGGMSYPFQKLSSAIASSEMDQLIEHRQVTESGLPSFTLDAGLGYEFTNGIFVQAGILYNKTNIRFLQRSQYIVKTSTSINDVFIYNSEGEIIGVNQDTIVVHEYGVRESEGMNKFNTINIPVSVGYIHPINDRMNLRASMGLSMNLIASTSGKMVDYNDEPYTYNDEDNPVYKDNFGLSYFGGLSLETKLNEKLIFDTGLNFRQHASNINLVSNPVDEKILNFGITAGLKFRI